MSEGTVFYRRNLPHIHPKDGIIFITVRLAGSLPAHVAKRLKEEKESEINSLQKKYSGKEFRIQKHNLDKRYFAKYDNLLDDLKTGPMWLKEERIAQIVVDKIHYLDGKKYHLMAYCIMSNHYHLVIDMMGFYDSTPTNTAGKTKDYAVADAMRLLNGNTARFCNLALGRTGAFWDHESYDHFARDEEEFYRIIEYVLNNPVKAGLVKNWQDWKWSYLAEM